MDVKSKSDPSGISSPLTVDLPSSPPFISRGSGSGSPAPSAGGTESIAAGSSSARYKAMSPASLPISRSACLTIPPGLSPTTLLESPVMLSNSALSEPSPTTGTFSFHLYMGGHANSGISETCSSSRNVPENLSSDDCNASGNFIFKTQIGSGRSSSILDLSNSGSKSYHNVGVGDHQGLSDPQRSVKIETMPSSGQDLTLSVMASDAFSQAETANDGTTVAPSAECQIRTVSNIEARSLPLQQHGVLTVVEKPSEDGYNWRKYGQKLVKGSDFPRSYYKCTHPNCQMKKKLERSHDGLVLKIIYEGVHDHPKPQPSRRLAVGSNVHGGDDMTEALQASTHVEDKLLNARPPNQFDRHGIPESCSVSSEDDGDTTGPYRDNLREEPSNDDDQESKRRKMEAAALDSTFTTRTTREARVVVQTLSEVDILDDGYRWRKYGQKVVKGNPNPRSYYKCTNTGCPVRKHVERASHDPKAVITTYEGKHNHDVPTGTSQESSLTMVPHNFNPLNGRSTTMARSSVLLKPPNHMDNARTIAFRGDPECVSLDLGVGLRQVRDSNSIQKQNAEAENFLNQACPSTLPPATVNNSISSAGITPIYGNGIIQQQVDRYGLKARARFSFDTNLSANYSADRFHQGTVGTMLGSEVDAANNQQFR